MVALLNDDATQGRRLGPPCDGALGTLPHIDPSARRRATCARAAGPPKNMLLGTPAANAVEY